MDTTMAVDSKLKLKGVAKKVEKKGLHGGMPYNHQFTATATKCPSPPRKIRFVKSYDAFRGPICKEWLYDCDAPFVTDPPSDLVSLCNTALKDYENLTNTPYTFIRLLKASSVSIGSCSDYDLIFKAGFRYTGAETFEASIKAGIQFHQGKSVYSSVVKNVFIGRGSLFPHWIVGEYTRKCVYDSDVGSPYYSVSPYATQMLVKMSQLAIHDFNLLKGTNYECVQLPLRAFYSKKQNTLYFDVRFLASLPQTCPEIFEAQLCQDERTPVSLFGTCYCIYGVSQGCGSLFSD